MNATFEKELYGMTIDVKEFLDFLKDPEEGVKDRAEQLKFFEDTYAHLQYLNWKWENKRSLMNGTYGQPSEWYPKFLSQRRF